MRLRLIGLMAGREWRSALSARWFWFYFAAAAALGAGLLWTAAAMLPGGVPEAAASGRVLLSTVNLLALLVPLMGLTAGAQSLARERDRRTLGYLLAQPITRSEVVLGKLAGNAMALGAALGGAMLVLAAAAWFLQLPLPGSFLLAVAALAWLLSLSTMSLGAVLSAGPGGLVAVQGAMLAAWLLLVLLGDVGLMGLVMFRQLPPGALLSLAFLNPVHQFRVASMALLSPSLEVLGPVGLYARERIGDGLVPALLLSQILWTGAAVLLALERFRKSRALS